MTHYDAMTPLEKHRVWAHRVPVMIAGTGGNSKPLLSEITSILKWLATENKMRDEERGAKVSQKRPSLSLWGSIGCSTINEVVLHLVGQRGGVTGHCVDFCESLSHPLRLPYVVFGVTETPPAEYYRGIYYPNRTVTGYMTPDVCTLDTARRSRIIFWYGDGGGVGRIQALGKPMTIKYLEKGEVKTIIQKQDIDA